MLGRKLIREIPLRFLWDLWHTRAGLAKFACSWLSGYLAFVFRDKVRADRCLAGGSARKELALIFCNEL